MNEPQQQLLMRLIIAAQEQASIVQTNLESMRRHLLHVPPEAPEQLYADCWNHVAHLDRLVNVIEEHNVFMRIQIEKVQPEKQQ